MTIEEVKTITERWQREIDQERAKILEDLNAADNRLEQISEEMSAAVRANDEKDYKKLQTEKTFLNERIYYLEDQKDNSDLIKATRTAAEKIKHEILNEMFKLRFDFSKEFSNAISQLEKKDQELTNQLIRFSIQYRIIEELSGVTDANGDIKRDPLPTESDFKWLMKDLHNNLHFVALRKK